MQANVIRGKIITQYGSLTKFADELGWAPTKISRILREKQDMTVKDAKQFADKLQIEDPSEVVALFL